MCIRDSESIGVKNVVAKSLGSRNPINLALASIDALKKCKVRDIEEKERNVQISTDHQKNTEKDKK